MDLCIFFVHAHLRQSFMHGFDNTFDQHTAKQYKQSKSSTLHKQLAHRNTLQHTATHCNTLQDTATHCNTLQHTTTHCNTLQHARGEVDFRQNCIHESFDAVRTDLSATHCNTLKHTAKHNTYWSDRHVKILDSPVLIPSAGSISQKSVL